MIWPETDANIHKHIGRIPHTTHAEIPYVL